VKKSSIEKVVVQKKLGGVIEEALSSVKLISSFAQEEREFKKFEKFADESRIITQQAEAWLSGFIALFRFFIYGFYVYSFWLASKFIQDNRINPNTGNPYNVGELLSIMVSLITGMMMLFGLTPNIQAMVKAKVVGFMIFEVIDRKPEVRDNEVCLKEVKVEDAIYFEDITFRYPKAPPKVKNVLNKASFKIRAGESTAIVGPSGSGKSTIVQLIERFYDPAQGEIFFDQVNIKDIEVKTLRESIGYVSQEPVLILGTVKDNLLFGNRDASDEDIKWALSQANADFVYEMENGLDTYIGSASVLNLSGGQKQRIAIARAIIKRPKILILDEATSALDPRSEKEVQDAVDHIAKNSSHTLTIVMIAHRLETIKTADNLLYIESNNSVLPGAKSTPEYDDIMLKLIEINYAHQKEDEDTEKEASP